MRAGPVRGRCVLRRDGLFVRSCGGRPEDGVTQETEVVVHIVHIGVSVITDVEDVPPGVSGRPWMCDQPRLECCTLRQALCSSLACVGSSGHHFEQITNALGPPSTG